MDQTLPIVRLYERAGKMKTIDANGSIEEIFS